MKHQGLSLVTAMLILAASTAAEAKVSISVGINPFGFGGYPPPVVYQPPVYYAPPPVVYYGGGSWGGRDRHQDHRRGPQRNRGHR